MAGELQFPPHLDKVGFNLKTLIDFLDFLHRFKDLPPCHGGSRKCLKMFQWVCLTKASKLLKFEAKFGANKRCRTTPSNIWEALGGPHCLNVATFWWEKFGQRTSNPNCKNPFVKPACICRNWSVFWSKHVLVHWYWYTQKGEKMGIFESSMWYKPVFWL